MRFIAENTVRSVSPIAKIAYGTGPRGWVGDIPRFEFDTRKIQSLGWKPRLTSDEAVLRSIREIASENGFS